MNRSTQFISSSSWKSRRSCRADDSDRISDLPDGIIGHILSRLPIKDAIRTSVLSRDWEFNWKFIYSLDIVDIELEPSGEPEKQEIFVKSMDRILLHLHDVKSFHLAYSPSRNYNLSRLTLWISAVLRRNLESLRIEYARFDIEEDDLEPILLPPNLLNCTSLRELEVKLPCTFKIATKIYFANLTTLDLYSVQIQNENSNSNTLILAFPVLETIEVVDCKWLNVNFVEIYAPSLIEFTSLPPVPVESLHNCYSIKILGATLDKFEIDVGFIESFYLSGSTVVHADLTTTYESVFQDLKKSVQKLLIELLNVTDLSICDILVEAIAQTELGPPLPRFHALKNLEVSDPRDGKGLLKLLHAAPFLESLEVELVGSNDHDYDEVESVPTCIASRLEEVKIMYSGCNEEHQFHLEKFLLKNALELKRIVLVGHCCELLEKEFYEQMSNSPKGSACLTIEPITLKLGGDCLCSPPPVPDLLVKL